MDVNPKITEIVDCLYRVAVKALIVRDDKILLVRDKNCMGWEFPGGGVDYGEELESALARELVEELGLENKKDVSIDITTQSVIIGHVKEGLPRCNIHYLGRITSPLNDSLATGNMDVDEIKWFSLSKVENLDFDRAAGPKDKIISLIKTLTA